MNRKKPIKAITMIQLGLAGVLLVVLALFVYWYADGLSSYSPKALTYQYIGGQTLNYSDNATFREHEHLLTVSDDNGQRELPEMPILHEGSSDITLAKNVLLMVPSEGTEVKRINRFTTVSNNDGRITYQAGKKSTTSFGGFLHDGKDIYIFLEDTALTIGNQTVELPAMSYARVIYAQSVEFHNSETDEDKVVEIEEIEVTAKCKSGYELNLGKDMIHINNQEALLFSSVDRVNVIEME